jgi:hypothetical protein
MCSGRWALCCVCGELGAAQHFGCAPCSPSALLQSCKLLLASDSLLSVDAGAGIITQCVVCLRFLLCSFTLLQVHTAPTLALTTVATASPRPAQLAMMAILPRSLAAARPLTATCEARVHPYMLHLPFSSYTHCCLLIASILRLQKS